MLPLGLPRGLLGEGSQVGSCCCFLGRPRPRFCGAGAAGCPWADVDGCPAPSPRALILPPAAATAASAATAAAAARPPPPWIRPAPFGSRDEEGWRRQGRRVLAELARAEGCCCLGCLCCHHQHRTSSGCQKEREGRRRRRGGGGGGGSAGGGWRRWRWR